SLARLDTVASLPRLSTTALAKDLHTRLKEWRSLLDAEPVKARQILRKLVDGRLVFTPDPARQVYTFTGTASYGRLLAVSVVQLQPVQNEVCPRGDSNPRHAV